jgi:hypothetical protein
MAKIVDTVGIDVILVGETLLVTLWWTCKLRYLQATLDLNDLPCPSVVRAIERSLVVVTQGLEATNQISKRSFGRPTYENYERKWWPMQ